MGSLNPAGVLGAVYSSPHHGRGLQEIVYRVSGGGAHNVTVETRLKNVLAVLCVNETDGLLVVPSISASTKYPNTKKVTIAVASSKTYHVRVLGYLSETPEIVTTSGNLSVDYNPIDI
jgi:hypothetical protein